ncbi:hypothetical protein [Snuella sedimenti]|uniref:Uncharacterized protein n=1 Tax=Snuella sedimenti TaxID=2798802 RepID=A0A8J7IVA2_9FLAO|nr:hypothetical protein [Snuella sedimenti]MBJ6367510.1 hypothetical protein [Snuella sedimenti]
MNLISCLFPMILTLIVIRFIFKNRFKTNGVFSLIRWIIISYTIIALLHFLTSITIGPDEHASTYDRATGPYKWAYWLMLLCSTLFPLSLFFKRLASKPYYLLVVAFFMKIGWYFELFVITLTSYHRDYVPDESNIDWTIPIGIQIMYLQGFILAFILLGVFELLGRRKQAVSNQ